MAISGKTLLGISLGAFGLSLMAASGPAGLPVASALLTGLVIAATIASLVHFAPLAPRMHFGFFPSMGFLHRPWFGGLHSRSFVPSARFGATTHSRTFVPARTPSYTPGWGATLSSGFSSFGRGHTVHTGRTFVPRH